MTGREADAKSASPPPPESKSGAARVGSDDLITRARGLLARTEGHTPGAWRQGAQNEEDDYVHGGDSPGMMVVEVLGSPDFNADARAIAALPELRALLLECVEALYELDALRALIAGEGGLHHLISSPGGMTHREVVDEARRMLDESAPVKRRLAAGGAA